ncbi:hypothetical protein [Ferdinandcohnia sp. SAFN-114]|uniref:hypothetical protein n=1 Tax=Ferdinandcohnia sp. SAFN-114 TaxID=3387275 RepID=UPI003F7FC5FC
MGRKFYSRGAKEVTNAIDNEKLEQVKTLLAETKRLQNEDEWVKADEFYFQLLDKGLLEWMIEELEGKSNSSAKKEKGRIT